METILLNLNPYWIELIASVGFTMSIIIYEILGIIGLGTVTLLFADKLTIELIMDVITSIISDLGLKWLFFITLSQHLAVGFFCITTFSNMLQEIRRIIRCTGLRSNTEP